MKKNYLIIIVFLFALFVVSCKNSGDFKTHETGLEYKIIAENPDSVMPQIGDILVLKLKYTRENDSILFDTKEIQTSFRMKMDEPSHSGGCIEDAFGMMHVGDSAIFKINAKDFFEQTKERETPDFIKPDEKLIFYIKLIKIFNYKEWKVEREKMLIANEEQEMDLLKGYLQRTSTKVEPTESGLYFVSNVEGKGKQPKKGDNVSVHYTGAFISGKPFSSSYELNEPMKFRLGINEVIEGWDQGIALMKEGGSATLIIPSKLAYKDVEQGPIPPYSTLVFEIELLSVTSY